MYKITDLEKTLFRKYDNIPNNIPHQYLKNAERLIDLITRITHQWGSSKIPFTCAYRGEVLNRKMGGVPNSMHQKACAVDFVIRLEDQDRFMNMLKDHFYDEIDFAQNYIYRIRNGRKIPRNFVHVNIADQSTLPRKLFKTEIHKRNTIIFGSQGKSIALFSEA